MHRQLVVILASVCLSACQAADVPPLRNLNSAYRGAARPGGASSPNSCGVLALNISKKGGKQDIPDARNSSNFGGAFYYGPLSKKFKSSTVVASCSDDFLGLPVPAGYTADWYGEWAICLDKPCNSLAFGGTGLTGEIQSTTWSPSVKYSLFLYTVNTDQFIESYPIGPLSTKKRKPGVLSFSSPFQNGFVYPDNDEVGLEIVHQSP